MSSQNIQKSQPNISYKCPNIFSKVCGVGIVVKQGLQVLRPGGALVLSHHHHHNHRHHHLHQHNHNHPDKNIIVKIIIIIFQNYHHHYIDQGVSGMRHPKHSSGADRRTGQIFVITSVIIILIVIIIIIIIVLIIILIAIIIIIMTSDSEKMCDFGWNSQLLWSRS